MRYGALMSSSAQRRAGIVARPGRPGAGRPKVLLSIAALVTILASFLPWLDTALLGSVTGMAIGAGTQPIADGLLTFYAGLLALPGLLWRNPRIVAGHALLLAMVALAVPGWRLIWALQRLPGFGEAWLPGPGMLLVLISGVVAAVAAVQLLMNSSRAAPSVPGAAAGD